MIYEWYLVIVVIDLLLDKIFRCNILVDLIIVVFCIGKFFGRV